MDVYQADALSGPRCSTLAGELGEPLAGTASPAATWLCVEQPGPWGREALRESHFDTGVGRELAELSAGTGVRVALIRRPGRHPDRHRPIPRRVYLAHTAPGRTWLERWLVGDPKELLDLDFVAAGAGIAPGLGDPVPGPLPLICTNGRRDVCCALAGRPLAESLAGEHGEDVWECTHLGGHRFAPTALVLPDGYAYGRLSVTSAGQLLASRGILVDSCRGRSTWSTPGQVAELAVRQATGDSDPDSLVVSEAASMEPIVSHVDGRRWRVSVVERTSADLRSASCGAIPKPSTYLEVEGMRV